MVRPYLLNLMCAFVKAEYTTKVIKSIQVEQGNNINRGRFVWHVRKTDISFL